MATNDNTPSTDNAAFATDPNGHAALLLVESLMHGLCENETLTNDEAIEITERSVNIQGEHAEAADGAGAPLWRAHAMLTAIAESLKTEGRTLPTSPRLVP